MKTLRYLVIFSALLAATHAAVAETSQSLGGITLTSVSPRIVTPNGDGLNDVIFFRFDTTLSGLPLETAIFDINGAKIAGMTLNSTDDSALNWDGKDDGGHAVPSGVYIYSIKLGTKQATGTVVVAR